MSEFTTKSSDVAVRDLAHIVFGDSAPRETTIAHVYIG